MVISETYQRNQLEEALFRYGRLTDGSREPNRTFTNQIKRLHDIDLIYEPFSREDAKPAFTSSAHRGQGINISYSFLDVFVTALGLDLLAQGFKQSEVVLALRTSRSDLSRVIRKIQASPPSLAGPRAPEDAKNKPIYVNKYGFKTADEHVYILFRRIEMPSIESSSPGHNVSSFKLIRPKIIEGRVNLNHYLEEMVPHRRGLIMFEIAYAYVWLNECLERTEPKKRGRK